MRIAFVASECVPFSKTGGLADVVGALPEALAGLGHEVEVILPRYRATAAGPVNSKARNMTLPLGGGYHYAALQKGPVIEGVAHHFVDLPEFFDREGIYQTRDGVDYADNAQRFAAFAFAALEGLKRVSKPPDVIHCHDWQTALVPVYLKRLYARDPFFARASTVLTIHNLSYQGLFPREILPQISIDASLFTMDGLEFYGRVNFLKGGLLFSDFITTVSRKYAEEIQTPEFGCGLDGVLRARSGRLQGILNGVDYAVWNPARDKLIPARYSAADLSGKRACKRALLERMGGADSEVPVIGIVSRFAAQKGFDLLAQVAPEIARLDAIFVALGTGEPEYEQLFRRLASDYPEKFLVKVAYDNELAHLVEAGADIFLMPSRFEPCGLNQIYSLKYGAPPVVRATGGLDDTIEDFNGDHGAGGDGFKFEDYSPQALLAALERALSVHHQPELWRRVMLNGMAKDFSWAASARLYGSIYDQLGSERARTNRGISTSNGVTQKAKA